MRWTTGAWTLLLGLMVSGCGDAGGANPAPTPPPDQVLEPCLGQGCPPCASRMEGCAVGVDHLPGTCCGVGDALLHLDAGPAAEAVDVESNGAYAILCGGFGARINDVRDPEDVRSLGSAGDRCQHAAFGHEDAEGQTFLLAHHGDSWVVDPSLSAWRITPGGSVLPLSSLTEEGILYEGLAHRDGHVYVAAHGEGLRIYELAADGSLSFRAAVTDGLGNPWKVALDGDRAFVADRDLGIAVVDVADPGAPSLVGVTPTAGPAVDIHVGDERIFVAEGGFGVEIFERDDDGLPVAPARLIDTKGTAQAVSAQRDVLAIASWSHVALHDVPSGVLLTTEKTRNDASFEQDLGVAMVDDLVFVAEWEGMHVLRHQPGRLAADLWLDDQVLEYPATKPGTRALVLRNRGHLPLLVDDVRPDAPAFSTSPTSLRIEPGQGDFVEIGYTPPGPLTGLSDLLISTNDFDRPLRTVDLVSVQTDRIDVGDPLDGDFGFLDPSGAGQLSGLEGKVVVLAYFALF